MRRIILCLILISVFSLLFACQNSTTQSNGTESVPSIERAPNAATVSMSSQEASSTTQGMVSTQETFSSEQASSTQHAPASLINSTTTSSTPQIDSTTLQGVNPISIRSVKWLGYQQANNSCSHRDLGFTGKLAGKWYAVYGDTLWAAPGVTSMFNDTPGFHGIVRDSISLMTDDPLAVVDLHLNNDEPVPHQLQFVPYFDGWGETNRFGFGGTSVCEVDGENAIGVVYYLVNANEAGLIGAGAGKIQVLNGTPTVTERFGIPGYWWDANTTARYGDVCAYRDEWSHHIYIWGGPPTYVKDWGDMAYSYLARVKAKDAFDPTGYEYWWGRQRGWKKEVLTSFTPETAALWGTGQGQVLWSKWFGCYVMVHTSTFGSTIMLRTALSPEGPWTPDIEVYTAVPIDDGMVYAGVAHPYHDESGETLILSYTNSNYIEVLKVEFD
ncbi:hypothetical protein QBC44DRAFT_371527 [Cladorrhinum sp. PSN332]|nr:hypothetical protein QBC44DRAFT_371527 [Cladorrhinum sp. PSN332]